MHPPISSPIRILIADDHPMMRSGIAAALLASGAVEIVAEVANGDDAIAAFARHRPDVSLVDLQMPGKDGMEAILAIRALQADARIVVLTTFSGDARVSAALAAGAAAYLLKDTSAQQLAATVCAVHQGATVVAPEVRREVDLHFALDALSPRELEVLRLAACGKSNRQIGALLDISEATVKTHMSRILIKLGANDRAHAVTLATMRGFINL